MFDVEKVFVDGLEVGLDVVRVGNMVGDIVRVLVWLLEVVGIECGVCVGYLIGLFYLFDWGECMILICDEDVIVL